MFVFYKLPWDDGSFPISNAMALGIWGGEGGEGEAVLSLPFSDGPKAWHTCIFIEADKSVL